MTITRQRRWNVTVAVLVITAVLVLVTALNRLEVQQVRSRDSLRLTTTPRLLSSQGQPSDQLGALRGSPMKGLEAAQDLAQFDATPYHLQVGVYPLNNYTVNFLDPSFQSSGYVWFGWDQPFQDYLTTNGYKPEELFVPINAIGGSSASILHPLGRGVIKRIDGGYYSFFSYQGKFYIDRLDFRHFPFGDIGLPIVIEVEDPDGALDFSGLRFVPDIKDSGVGGYSDISGWVNRGWSFAEYRHHFATGFGLGEGESDYSQAVFEVNYGTSVWAAFWKLLQPLLVVMAMVVLIAKLPRDLDDVRVGIPATVLLTLVFLQQSYQSTLPTLPYLSFLDKVYVVCYVVSLLTFMVSLWVARRHHESDTLTDPVLASAIEARIRMLDNLWPPSILVLMGAAVSLSWFVV
jgi:hypothetical protein